MWLASGAATSTEDRKGVAWTMRADRGRRRLMMMVMVRAMVPVAGMPPKNGVMKLATPCAISSWLGLCRSSIRPSAMRAHSRDSMAPSNVSVRVGMNRKRALLQLNSGHCKVGRCAGMPPNLLPIVSTGSERLTQASVANSSAMMEPGTALMPL